MQKLQKFLNFTVLATETSHVFCCVLPTVFSIAGLLAGVGLIGAIPPGIESLHDIVHDWEMPIIAASGVILLLGWLVYFYAQKIDCHEGGCAHGPCEPSKKRSSKVLKIATVLFVVNVSIYFFVHRPIDQQNHAHDHAEEAAHEDHVGHNH